ncbi:YceI family protein [Lentisalinibacter sediminis]|uniref:YceI family protein n=1 Tax=Lentisalinibacter sediminis TaxID=2992237 RepID=UPI00386B14BA
MPEPDRTIYGTETPRPRLSAAVAAAAALVLLAACAGRAPVEPAPTAEESRAAEVDRATATEYRIDTEASLLQLHVYRAGPLARLGHNHVVASRDLQGSVWHRDRQGRSGFRISLPVAELTVDEPALREAAGDDFPGEIPPEDVEATRRNMLGESVLDAARHPELTAELVAVEDRGEALTVTAALTIRGRRQLVDFPVQLRVDEGRLVATGETTVSHAALGLEPFSVMGGALSVAEDIGVRYRVVARRR